MPAPLGGTLARIFPRTSDRLTGEQSPGQGVGVSVPLLQARMIEFSVWSSAQGVIFVVVFWKAFRQLLDDPVRCSIRPKPTQ